MIRWLRPLVPVPPSATDLLLASHRECAGCGRLVPRRQDVCGCPWSLQQQLLVRLLVQRGHA